MWQVGHVRPSSPFLRCMPFRRLTTNSWINAWSTCWLFTSICLSAYNSRMMSPYSCCPQQFGHNPSGTSELLCSFFEKKFRSDSVRFIALILLKDSSNQRVNLLRIWIVNLKILSWIFKQFKIKIRHCRYYVIKYVCHDMFILLPAFITAECINLHG